MKDIRFRAWDKKKNDWFDEDGGDLYIELNGNIGFGWNGEIMDDYTDRVVLNQYTGKKDINGVEIYDGYIVNNGQYTYLVRFGEFAEGQTGFYIVDISNDETFPFYSMVYEVIGNIYENKDLLED